MPRRARARPRTRQSARRRRAPPRRRVPRPMSRAAPSNQVAKLVHQVCSITDPFCPAALGSKIHDTGSSRSLSLQSHGFYSLTASSAGVAAAAFSPDFTAGVRSATTITSSVVSVWSSPGTTPYSGVTSLPGIARFRIVSIGITLKSTTAATANAGSLGILSIPGGSGSVNVSAIGLNDTVYTANTRTPMLSTKGLTAIGLSDGVTSSIYNVAVTDTTTTVTSNGNDILVPYIIGSTVGATAEVEYWINWEFMFPADNSFNAMTTPAAVQNDTVNTAANAVKRTMDVVLAGTTNEVTKQIHARASGWAQRLIQAGANMFLGPVGGAAAGMIMDAIDVD